ncbi:MAG TPA: hypothetical protein VFY39_00360 [Gammaproteobacteria bacterium]|nr:hypothetical protein [Gammaproteobacteria bacterium]
MSTAGKGSIDRLHHLVGEWELAVGVPGAEDVRGHVVFETLGELLVRRTTVPLPDAPDSHCIVVAGDDGTLRRRRVAE